MLTLLMAAQNYWAGIKEDRGASMVEYALLVVLIAIVALLAVKFAGTKVSSTFSNIGSGLTQP